MITVLKEMCIVGNCAKFYFIFKGIKPDLNYPVKCFHFSMSCKLCPLITLFIDSKKNVNYAWIVHRWIVNCWIMYRELAQP